MEVSYHQEKKRDKWNPEESCRYKDAPFDVNRICMHVWKPGQLTSQYIFHPESHADYFIAFPLSVAAGYIIHRDLAGTARGDIGIYHPNGVEIPIERGIIFLTRSRLVESWDSIYKYAQRTNPEDPIFAIMCNFQLIPYTSNLELLYDIVSRRIRPATYVKYTPLQVTYDYTKRRILKICDMREQDFDEKDFACFSSKYELGHSEKEKSDRFIDDKTLKMFIDTSQKSIMYQARLLDELRHQRIDR